MTKENKLPWERVTRDFSIEKYGLDKKQGYFIPEEEAKELLELKEENAKLRKALEIYGDEDNWYLDKNGLHGTIACWNIGSGEEEFKPWLIATEALKENKE